MPATIYIYIFTYLLSTSIHCYQEKRKKNRQDLEIIISRITARGEKKNIIGPKKKEKKEKANFVTPVEKNQEICNQLVKRKRKPTVKGCKATIAESAQYKVEPITNIKSRVGPFLLKYRLTGSSENLVPISRY